MADKPASFTPRLRCLLGWTLILVGLPLYVLPLPLGVPLIVPGVLLVISGSAGMRRRFVGIKRFFPVAYEKFKLFRKRHLPGNGRNRNGPR